MDFRTKKAEIRSQVLARRDQLDPLDRIEMGLSACEYGANLIHPDPGTIVSGFLPIRSEIDARPLMDRMRQRGARLCVPIIADKTTIVFRELVRGAELVSTGFGTSGPGPDAPVLDPHIMIVPLAAFDRTGGRIGYGAGYYDRAINRLFSIGIKPRLFGFAFSIQEVDKVPTEAHDQHLEAVITEKGIIDCMAIR